MNRTAIEKAALKLASKFSGLSIADSNIIEGKTYTFRYFVDSVTVGDDVAAVTIKTVVDGWDSDLEFDGEYAPIDPEWTNVFLLSDKNPGHPFCRFDSKNGVYITEQSGAYNFPEKFFDYVER